MLVLSILYWLSVAVTGAAFGDALLRPAAAWSYAGVDRRLWLALTGGAVGVAVFLGGGLGLFGMIGVVAALVYWLEQRPKLRSYPRPRRRSTPSPWS